MMKSNYIASVIAILTENVDGTLFLLTAESFQELYEDCKDECSFVPENDARVYFVSFNGRPVNPYKYGTFESVITMLKDMTKDAESAEISGSKISEKLTEEEICYLSQEGIFPADIDSSTAWEVIDFLCPLYKRYTKEWLCLVQRLDPLSLADGNPSEKNVYGKPKERLLSSVKRILDDDEKWEEFLETFSEKVSSESFSDDATPKAKWLSLVEKYIADEASRELIDETMCAFTGWSMDTLLEKAEEEYEGWEAK